MSPSRTPMKSPEPQETSLQELFEALDDLGWTSYWAARAASDTILDQDRISAAVQTFQDRAERVGATIEQIDDAKNYGTRRWLSAQRPHSRGVDLDALLRTAAALD